MPTTVEAIYEDGKLVLSKPLPIENHTVVRIVIETAGNDEEREAWLKASEASLAQLWSNTEDDIFNELLEK